MSNASGQIEKTLAYEGVAQVGNSSGVPVIIVTDSHVVGVAKPDARVFADAIRAMGMSPRASRTWATRTSTTWAARATRA